MIQIGGENFLNVSGFLGHTRVHVRRHVCDDDGLPYTVNADIQLFCGVFGGGGMIYCDCMIILKKNTKH